MLAVPIQHRNVTHGRTDRIAISLSSVSTAVRELECYGHYYTWRYTTQTWQSKAVQVYNSLQVKI